MRRYSILALLSLVLGLGSALWTSTGAGALISTRAPAPTVACQVYKTATTSLGTGSWTVLTWEAAMSDPLSMWSSGANTRVTVGYNGVYRVQCTIRSTAAGIDLALYKNGSILGLPWTAKIDLASTIAAAPWQVALLAGDYLEVYAYDAAAGTTVVGNLTGEDSSTQIMRSSFTVQRIGP